MRRGLCFATAARPERGKGSRMQTVPLETAVALIGTDLGASDWKLIDQPLVTAFADLTGDRQFIHVDPEAAARTPFGGAIAHGFLTLSLIATLFPPGAIWLEGTKMGVNYGFDRVRFLQPIRVGKRIRARHVLRDVKAKGADRVLVTTEVTIEIEGESKPAVIADWLNLQVL